MKRQRETTFARPGLQPGVLGFFRRVRARYPRLGLLGLGGRGGLGGGAERPARARLIDSLVWLRLSALGARRRPTAAPSVPVPASVAVPLAARPSVVEPRPLERRILELRTLRERIRERVALGSARVTVGQAASLADPAGRHLPFLRSSPSTAVAPPLSWPFARQSTPPTSAPQAAAATPHTRRPASLLSPPSRPTAQPRTAPARPTFANNAAAFATLSRRGNSESRSVPAPSVPAGGVSVSAATTLGPNDSARRSRESRQEPELLARRGMPRATATPSATVVEPALSLPRTTAISHPLRSRGDATTGQPAFLPLTARVPEWMHRSRPRNQHPRSTLLDATVPALAGPGSLRLPPPAAASVGAAELRFPVAPRLPTSPLRPPDAPHLPRVGTLPLVVRQPPHHPTVEALPFVRQRERTVDVGQLQETVTRRVEETLHGRVVQDVEAVVARELSPDSPLARRLGERLYGGLYEKLLLEKERLGWG